MRYLNKLKPQADGFKGERPVDGLPGHPQGDTASLVPVVALTEDMLLTRDGAFLIMLEMPPLDIGFAGQDFSRWMERYQLALDRLPPGTAFQMTVLLEPHDPTKDLKYFLDRAKAWEEVSSQPDLSQRKQLQAESLAHAAQEMTASLAAWFDDTNPVHWRTIFTLAHHPIPAATKSLLFSRNGKDPDDLQGMLSRAPAARDVLQERLSIFTSAFSAAGIPLHLMEPGEMCQVIWRALHPATTQDTNLSAQHAAIELASGGHPFRKPPPPKEAFEPDLPARRLASLLAPDTMLERENWIEIDGVKVSGYIVHDFMPNRPVMIHRLVNLEGGWCGTMHVEVADPSVVAGKLRQREVQLAALEHAKSSRGLLADFGAQQEVGAVQEQRMRMETIGQTPVFIRFFVMRTAPDEQTLVKRNRELESLLTTIGAEAFPARYSQLLLWKSTLPIGTLALNQKPRNMTPQSLGTFFWPSRKRLLEPNGVYLGIDENTRLPIRVDPFGSRADRTPSYLILGRPGAGKSVTLRMLQVSAQLGGGRVLAVDVEGEMRGFCEQYGGRYIEVGSSSGERINVLDIPPDSDDPLLAGTEHLIAFCESVRGQPIPKGVEWNALAEAYRLAVEDRGWLVGDETDPGITGWRHEDAPRLADVVRILETSPSPASNSLAEMLRPYAQGVYASYFNTPTTFDIAEEQLVIFGLQHVNDLSDQLRVYLWQVMGLIWGEVLRRNAVNSQSVQHVMLDEVWKLLDAPGGAGAVENMARRFRKRRTALWLATQQVGEFLDTPIGKRILSVVGNTLLMEQRPVEAKRLQATFDLTDHMRDSLQRLGTGHGVLVTPEGTLRVWVAIPEGWGVY